MILGVRTDSAEAEIVLGKQRKVVSHYKWEAGRQLSAELLPKIKNQLREQSAEWQDLEGIIFFLGPGSFTGLRIGATVCNSLAYGLNVPVVGAKGQEWVNDGLDRLDKRENDKQVLPFYGSEPNITKPSA